MMKKYFLIMLVVIVGLALTGVVSAADKDAIKAQVDEIAVAIEGGKPVSDFADAAKKQPHYVYIIEENGNVLVHPSLVGESLKEKAAVAYDAVIQGNVRRQLGDVRMGRRREKRLCQKNKDRGDRRQRLLVERVD